MEGPTDAGPELAERNHESTGGEDSSSQRGRPRNPDTDSKILEAALELMEVRGYARMSVDAVAARAGVTKPTIYRRFKSKEALAVRALSAYQRSNLPANTGDLRTDLVAHLRHFQKGVERPFGMAMIGIVLAEEHATPQLLGCFREHVVRTRREGLRTVLQAAQAQGEVRADVDLDLAVSMLVGAYYAQYLAGVPFPESWPEEAVSTLLRGL